MLKLLAVIQAILLLTINANEVSATQENDELPQCVVVSHCVLENWEVSNASEVFKQAKELVLNTPRTKIIESTDSFIKAEAKTKWMRYTDDLLIKALPNKSIIQVRSESRVGIGDNGVNQKRVNDLAYRLMLPSFEKKSNSF